MLFVPPNQWWQCTSENSKVTDTNQGNVTTRLCIVLLYCCRAACWQITSRYMCVCVCARRLPSMRGRRRKLYTVVVMDSARQSVPLFSTKLKRKKRGMILGNRPSATLPRSSKSRRDGENDAALTMVVSGLA